MLKKDKNHAFYDLIITSLKEVRVYLRFILTFCIKIYIFFIVKSLSEFSSPFLSFSTSSRIFIFSVSYFSSVFIFFPSSYSIFLVRSHSLSYHLLFFFSSFLLSRSLQFPLFVLIYDSYKYYYGFSKINVIVK